MKVKTIQSKNRNLDNTIKTVGNGRNALGMFTVGNGAAIGQGRPTGSKDKINVLRDMLLDELTLVYNGNTANVIHAIRRVMQDKPEHILNLAAKLIPNNIEIDITPDYSPVILEGVIVEKAPSDELGAIEGTIKMIED